MSTQGETGRWLSRISRVGFPATLTYLNQAGWVMWMWVFAWKSSLINNNSDQKKGKKRVSIVGTVVLYLDCALKTRSPISSTVSIDFFTKKKVSFSSFGFFISTWVSFLINAFYFFSHTRIQRKIFNWLLMKKKKKVQ